MATLPHVHNSPVQMVAFVAVMVAVFGTIHLLSLSSDSEWARAWISLGF